MSDISIKCRITGKEFFVGEWEQELLKKMDLPMPTICFEERLRRKLTFRNERNLYKNICALTKKPVISIYSDDKPFTIYSQEAWWSDKWDARDYSREYDFNRPFFDQFKELQLVVPRIALLNTHAENSEYCNFTTSNKNCYLVFGGDYNEDSMYSSFCMHSENCFDTYFIEESKFCYELIDSEKCYQVFYGQNCHNCSDGYFLFDCKGVSNCAFCVGLRNKKYCIFNKEYSQEDYEKKLKEFNFGNYDFIEKSKEEFKKFRLKFPHKYANIVNSENCSGENIVNAKNCQNVFHVFGPAEDAKDMYLAGWGLKDTYSCTHLGHKIELYYEVMSSIAGYNCAFSYLCWGSRDILYSGMVVNNSHDIFGCVGMKKAEYCILNKQYSKEEYFDLKKRIIEHMKATDEWGEFFPMSLSPFAYNETVANDIFPLTKAEVISRDLSWHEEEVRENKNISLPPSNINDVDENILKETFVCQDSGRPYKINEKELEFYKRMKIPVPRRASETRIRQRLAMRLSPIIYSRNCTKCGAKIETPYSKEKPEIVYCEKCYLENVGREAV